LAGKPAVHELTPNFWFWIIPVNRGAIVGRLRASQKQPFVRTGTRIPGGYKRYRSHRVEFAMVNWNQSPVLALIYLERKRFTRLNRFIGSAVQSRNDVLRRMIMSLFSSAAARLLAGSTLATLVLAAASNAQTGIQGPTPGQADGMMGNSWGWGMGNGSFGMGGFGGIGILVLALVVIAIAVLAFRRRN
jgi:hypothetical protein